MADDKKADKKPAKKLSKNVDKLVDEIAKLSVMELSELVNALQDKLGVTATAPVSTAPATTTDQAEGKEAAGGAAKQTVVLKAVGENKIAAIKAIREIDQSIGLKEAKDMTENLPAEVLKDAKAEDAKTAVEKLKSAGCTVELK
jgi:large subunit ribosomal protein L7/L12